MIFKFNQIKKVDENAALAQMERIEAARRRQIAAFEAAKEKFLEEKKLVSYAFLTLNRNQFSSNIFNHLFISFLKYTERSTSGGEKSSRLGAS